MAAQLAVIYCNSHFLSYYAQKTKAPNFACCSDPSPILGISFDILSYLVPLHIQLINMYCPWCECYITALKYYVLTSIVGMWMQISANGHAISAMVKGHRCRASFFCLHKHHPEHHSSTGLRGNTTYLLHRPSPPAIFHHTYISVMYIAKHATTFYSTWLVPSRPEAKTCFKSAKRTSNNWPAPITSELFWGHVTQARQAGRLKS